MTVEQLIAWLERFDPEATVVFWNGGDYYELENIARDHNGDVGINWKEPV